METLLETFSALLSITSGRLGRRYIPEFLDIPDSPLETRRPASHVTVGTPESLLG